MKATQLSLARRKAALFSSKAMRSEMARVLICGIIKAIPVGLISVPWASKAA